MKKTIAAFDIDGTILPGNSAERIFIKYLIGKGELRLADGVRYAAYLVKKLSGGWIGATKGNKYYLKGKNTARIGSLAEMCFHEEISPLISERARGKIEEHRARGEEIVLLSGTLDVLLERFSEHLRADHAHGSNLMVSDGRFTGEIEGLYPYGTAKADIVKQYYDSDSYDLSASSAFANHPTDLAFLELFGHKFLANPEPRFAEEARSRGIDILEF